MQAYAYADTDPGNRIDPSGLFSFGDVVDTFAGARRADVRSLQQADRVDSACAGAGYGIGGVLGMINLKGALQVGLKAGLKAGGGRLRGLRHAVADETCWYGPAELANGGNGPEERFDSAR